MSDSQNLTRLKLLGGELCLDFANGLKADLGDHRSGYLANYADLVRWARHAGALSEEGAARLLLEAEGRPREAAASFERAVSLREMVYRVFSAIARGVNPDPSELDLLSTAHVGTLERHHIRETEDGDFGWVRVEGTDDLEEPLWPVVLSATSLLTSGLLDRVKACPLEEGGCGWLFRDASKNKSRRWCAIGDCGTRVNMRRLYARKRAGKTDGGREDQSRPEGRAQE
jgi:predicted RNA-binding Zn ribbon-like protein